MTDGILYDEDIVDYINERLDYSIDDTGIGYYEYGDGKYLDKNIEMVLTEEEIMVQYTTDNEQLIPTLLHGTKTGHDNNDNDYESDWTAELGTVTWNQSTRTLDATYDITRE
jgi:hypothetical protein